MSRIACTALALGVFLALAPGGANAADGTITGLSFSPDPAKAKQDVTVTVLGTEKCKELQVSFGDQSPVVTLDNADFGNSSPDDNSATHKYASAGSYTVTATPVEQCTGSAQKTLKVNVAIPAMVGGTFKGQLPKGVMTKLCDVIDTCTPVLEALFPFSVVEPGGEVLAFGSGFGATPGELHLFLQTDGKDIKLTTQEWGSGYVGARIPASVIGVVDQPGEFYVKTAAGAESNRMGGASFTAKRGVRILDRGEAKVTSCSDDSNCDQCLEKRFASSDGLCFTGVPANGTIAAYHYNCWGCVGDDGGTDVYSPVPLKNGWVLEKVNLFVSVPPGEGSASANISEGGNVRVNWSVTPNDSVAYYGYVLIKGPMATPHK